MLKFSWCLWLLFFCQTALAASKVSDYTKQKLSNELPILGLDIGDEVLLRSFKKESQMELWVRASNKKKFTLFRTYPICYFSGGIGPKLKTGDKISPEGIYGITKQRLNPRSAFHLSMNIGYPNSYDRYYGRTGSLLMIHGACDAVGCYAMGNDQIEEVYYLVEQALNSGQREVPVHAFPYRMTVKNLSQYEGSRWYQFWSELKSAYDEFNQTGVIPNIVVSNGHYIVES